MAASVAMPPPAPRARANGIRSSAKIAQDIAAGSAWTAPSAGTTGAQSAPGQKRRSDTEPDRAGGVTLTPNAPTVAAPAWPAPPSAVAGNPSIPAWSSARSAHAPTAPTVQPTPHAVQPSAGHRQGSQQSQAPAPGVWGAPAPPPLAPRARPFLAQLLKNRELQHQLAHLPPVDPMDCEEYCVQRYQLDNQQKWQICGIQDEYREAKERLTNANINMIQVTVGEHELSSNTLRQKTHEQYGRLLQQMQLYEQQLQQPNAHSFNRQGLQQRFEIEKNVLEQEFKTSQDGLDSKLTSYKQQSHQQLQAELKTLDEELGKKLQATTLLHQEEQVELKKRQELAEEVKKEANEIWQWVVDTFDGQEDKMPLFIYYPEFDSCRLDWTKLYDFRMKIEGDLGKQMLSNDDPAL